MFGPLLNFPVLIVVIGSSIWVGTDASAYKRRWGIGPHGTDPAPWVVLCLLFWIIGFPAYLVFRRENAAQYVSRTKGRWRRKLEAKLRVPHEQVPAAAPAGGSFCPHCGAARIPDARFCNACRAQLG